MKISLNIWRIIAVVIFGVLFIYGVGSVLFLSEYTRYSTLAIVISLVAAVMGLCFYANALILKGKKKILGIIGMCVSSLAFVAAFLTILNDFNSRFSIETFLYIVTPASIILAVSFGCTAFILLVERFGRLAKILKIAILGFGWVTTALSILYVNSMYLFNYGRSFDVTKIIDVLSISFMSTVFLALVYLILPRETHNFVSHEDHHPKP